MDKEKNLHVKLSSEMHRKLKVEAARTGLSVRTLVNEALQMRVGRVRLGERSNDGQELAK
jgi:predicted HicB family RNase H-like nuclease